MRAAPTEAHGDLAGETLDVPDRLLVAPAAGTFRRLASLPVGASVRIGEAIGVVQVLGAAWVVAAHTDGTMKQLLVGDGERVRAGQPVAWLVVPDSGTPCC